MILQTSACHFYVISGHVNHYKVIYCLLQKIYRQSLKKIIYHTTKPRFPAQGQGQGRGLQGQRQKCWTASKQFTNTFIMLQVHFYRNKNTTSKINTVLYNTSTDSNNIIITTITTIIWGPFSTSVTVFSCYHYKRPVYQQCHYLINTNQNNNQTHNYNIWINLKVINIYHIHH